MYCASVYDDMIEAIGSYALRDYAIRKLKSDGYSDFNIEVEFAAMKPVEHFILEFWNWDKWTIIAEPHREEIKKYYFSKSK
jgi:hypothetical protein